MSWADYAELVQNYITNAFKNILYFMLTKMLAQKIAPRISRETLNKMDYLLYKTQGEWCGWFNLDLSLTLDIYTKYEFDESEVIWWSLYRVNSSAVQSHFKKYLTCLLQRRFSPCLLSYSAA